MTPRLTDPQYIQSLLARSGVAPKRSAGQNFLISDEVVEAIATITATGPNNITELGAGLGTATLPLLAQGKTVRAIEQDLALAEILTKQVPRKWLDQLILVTQDLKKEDWTWDTPYQIVGNIPYNLSGHIIRRLTCLAPAPVQVTLLVQQEVGLRLSAQPPDMSLISLAAQLWAEVTPSLAVPRGCFWPAPSVDSQLVLLVPHAEAEKTVDSREALLAFAKPLFQQRRKQLAATLSKHLGKPRAVAEKILAACDILPTARPQEVTLVQWQALRRAAKQ